MAGRKRSVKRTPEGSRSCRPRCPGCSRGSVRLHHRLPHHLSRLHDRARELSRGAERPAPAHRRRASTSGSSTTGRRSSPSPSAWASSPGSSCPTSSAPTGRSSPTGRARSIGPLMGYEVLIGLLPRGGLPRRHALRPRQGRPRPALPRDADGRDRHARLGLLDPQRQLLDADAGRLRDQRRRPVRAGGLVGGDLQPVLPLPARAHGARGLSHHRARGRRGRRLAPAARRAPSPRRGGCSRWRWG